jgi:hypothetical protein
MSSVFLFALCATWLPQLNLWAITCGIATSLTASRAHVATPVSAGHTARLPPVNATRANVGPNGTASFRPAAKGKILNSPLGGCDLSLWLGWARRMALG